MKTVKTFWLRSKVALGIFLVIMILLRLIWMQLRDFHPHFELRTIIGMEHYLDQVAGGCEFFNPLQFDDHWHSLRTILNQSDQLVSSVFGAFAKFSCREGKWILKPFQVYNENLLILCVFMSVFITRLLTGGWILSLVVGVILLSRGRFIASIGYVQPIVLTSTALVFYFVGLNHFLRTGWKAHTVVLPLLVLGISMVEPALMGASATLPIVLLLWKLRALATNSAEYSFDEPEDLSGLRRWWGYLRNAFGFKRYSYLSKEDLEKRGTLFSPMTSPFSDWVLVQKRWIKYFMLFGLVSIFVFFNILATSSLSEFLMNLVPSYNYFQPKAQQLAIWLNAFVNSLDLDLVCALLILLFNIFSSRRLGVPGFADVCLATIVSLITISIAAIMLDLGDTLFTPELGSQYLWTPGFRANQVVLWFEPILLTLATVGIFNIAKLIDAYFFRKKVSQPSSVS